MAMPTSVTVEIEFTAGVWTDVTAYLDGQAGGSTRFGRTSPYGAASPGTLTLTLANEDGRFTPGRQVLSDGVTVHPYYPNVVPRKRIRVAYIVAAVSYYRFTGYIKGWPPSMVGGDVPRVTINASTVDDRISRVLLLPPVQTVVSAQVALYSWPLTDPSGSATAAEANLGSSFRQIGTGTAPTFGDSNELASGDGPSIRFSPTASNAGRRMVASPLPGAGSNSLYSFSLWVNAGTSAPAWGATLGQNIAVISANFTAATPSSWFGLDTTGKPTLGGTGAPITGPTSILDGNWHLLTVTCNFFGTTTFYVDGVSAGTGTISGTFGTAWVFLGDHTDASPVFADARFQGNIAQVSLFTRVLSAAEVVTQYNAGIAWVGETVDARIARILGYAGLTSSAWNIDASAVTLSGYQQGGKDVITACQDAAASEGGGSVVYAGPDGKVQFRNRNDRLPANPAMTVNAEADLDGSAFSPVFDDTQIVNQVQASRAAVSATVSTQVANDIASQTTYGLTSSSFTSYADTDADVLANAQWQVAQQRNPAFQFGQLTLDLATATTAGLYAAVAVTDVGARIRVTNLPTTASPTSQVDVNVEGWADTFSTDQYTVTFDTSPADNPPGYIWDDATNGRWQCDGQTLNAAITNSATTIVVATAGGKPTFTTNAAMYPLKIVIGAEHIQLNSVPGGAATPQTFTGVTRGVDGTTAAAQAISSPVDLYPSSTWAL